MDWKIRHDNYLKSGSVSLLCVAAPCQLASFVSRAVLTQYGVAYSPFPPERLSETWRWVCVCVLAAESGVGNDADWMTKSLEGRGGKGGLGGLRVSGTPFTSSVLTVVARNEVGRWGAIGLLRCSEELYAALRTLHGYSGYRVFIVTRGLCTWVPSVDGRSTRMCACTEYSTYLYASVWSTA